MERYKQALEIFLKIDKTAPNGDHEVCYYIGMWDELAELFTISSYQLICLRFSHVFFLFIIGIYY